MRPDTDVMKDPELEIKADRWLTQVAGVQHAILTEMTPREIAQMIATHFDDSPEDTLDTAKALVREFVRSFGMTRADAHRWADEAFGV